MSETCPEHGCELTCARCEARRRGATGWRKAAQTSTKKQRKAWGRLGAQAARQKKRR